MFALFSDLPRRYLAMCTVLALLVGSVPTRADDLRESSSLQFVPADAAFFSSKLRNRQQLDLLKASKAFQSIMANPLVQAGLQQFKAEWDEPDDPQAAMFKALYEQPENQQLVKLLLDASSHEIFIYGDGSFADTLVLLNTINAANSAAQIESISSDEDSGKIVARKMLEELNKHIDDLSIPDLVIGFKVTDKQAAKDQLERLELLARLGIQQLEEQQPGFKDRFGRIKIGEYDFLTLKLDGSLLPWDKIPLDELGEDREQAERLIAKLRTKKLTISLGLRDDFLLLSIGNTNEHLEALGEGELLIDREEFAPLRELGDKPLTSIGYVSDEFMKRAGSGKLQIDQYVAMAEKAIPQTEQIPERLHAELIADAKALGEDFKSMIPEVGARLAFSYLTPAGYEGFAYNWSENLRQDASQKLTILDHVGENPLMFVAGRKKTSPESYDTFVKYVKRGVYYFEEMGLNNLGDDEQAKYRQFREEVAGLLARVDKTIRDKFVPAFADGQSAFVIDAKSTSKQWHESMPPSETPLPMLELGLIYGISDAKLLVEGASELYDVSDSVLGKIRDLAPPDKQIPLDKIPRPESREYPEGTIYYYLLPGAAGIDARRVAPNAGVSENILALTLMPRLTRRLLSPTPLQLDGPLANVDRPLAAAAHFDWAGMMDAITPWIDYGIDVSQSNKGVRGIDFDKTEPGKADAGDEEDAAEENEEPAEIPAGPSPEMIKQQVRVAMQFLKCFKGYSSATYIEDGATVKHFEWRFQDIE